ncbi:hypothetical protein AAFF_G00399470 [Aldrovandia affinis]|uniref:Uncharacterized protein n=1 Tax=Aldrovandia affinis TaxID=143900 RepID=A0AAD7SD65_9TELE|nr:hypothetical protein AAFF_G00399470 [Aldrovandia affinis]
MTPLPPQTREVKREPMGPVFQTHSNHVGRCGGAGGPLAPSTTPTATDSRRRHALSLWCRAIAGGGTSASLDSAPVSTPDTFQGVWGLCAGLFSQQCAVTHLTATTVHTSAPILPRPQPPDRRVTGPSPRRVYTAVRFFCHIASHHANCPSAPLPRTAHL